MQILPTAKAPNPGTQVPVVSGLSLVRSAVIK